MMRACTAYSPDEGVTSGSLSIQQSGEALRQACREARGAYLEAAARALGVDASMLQVRNGEIRGGGGSTSYAALADDSLLESHATGASKAVTAGTSERVGSPATRLDLPDKVMGRPRFVQDVLPKGILHGRVLRPPSPGARLESLDESKARAMPGVVELVRDGSFVGVLANREEIALAAIERLRGGARWTESETLPDETRLAEWLRAQPHETTPVASRAPSNGKREAARTLKATFTRPFIAHASLAPSCAGGALGWRSPACLEPYAGHLQPSRRPGDHFRRAAGIHRRRASRRRRLLRPQRRRRRGARRGPVGARGARSRSACLVVARRRARVAAVRPGDGGGYLRGSRRRG
jgi:hypothetical protein